MKREVRMLIAARALARSGLPVLPLLPQTKRPRYVGGYKSARLDQATILKHWQAHPRDNVGVRPPENMIVLDVDPRHGGDAQLRRMIADNGELPVTWTAATGSGGAHYWFTIGDVEAIRSTLRPGVDLKHGGTGFVVAPPSVHPNGTPYEWLIEPSGQPSTAPPWLFRAIQPPPREYTPLPENLGDTGTYTIQCLVARIGRAREGYRHTTFFGAVKDALRQGDLDAFEADLIAAATAVGLDVREVESTVRGLRREGTT